MPYELLLKVLGCLFEYDYEYHTSVHPFCAGISALKSSTKRLWVQGRWVLYWLGVEVGNPLFRWTLPI